MMLQILKSSTSFGFKVDVGYKIDLIFKSDDFEVTIIFLEQLEDLVLILFKFNFQKHFTTINLRFFLKSKDFQIR